MSDDNHGHTLAAWTASILIMVAFLVGTIGVVLAQPMIFWIGVALLPVAGIAGKVLALMGFGAQKS